MKDVYQLFVENIFGLMEEKPADATGIITILLDLYKEAKETKAYDKVDIIRAKLKEQGIVVKDMRSGIDWAYEE